MPRSTIVWAAALLVASMSGSGPMLTTADALPAPGPRETAMRPKYYYPRHIKRQIVTNSSTEITTSTTSSEPSTSTSSSTIELRQSDGDPSSFFSSLFQPPTPKEPTQLPDTTTGDASRPNPVLPSTGTGDAVTDPQLVTTTSNPPPPPPPPPSSTRTTDEEVGTTNGVPESPVQPTSTQPPTDKPAEPSKDEPKLPSPEIPTVVPSSGGSTGGIPSSVVPPSDPATTSTTGTSTGGVIPPVLPPISEPSTGSGTVLKSFTALSRAATDIVPSSLRYVT